MHAFTHPAGIVGVQLCLQYYVCMNYIS